MLHHVVGQRLVTGQGGDGPAQELNAGLIAALAPRREAVQQQARRRLLRVLHPARSPDRRQHLGHRDAELTGIPGRPVRVEQGVAGQARVVRLEHPGRVEQHPTRVGFRSRPGPSGR